MRIMVNLGDSPVQPLCCEVCDEPTTADSWIEGLRLLICPHCLEEMIDAATYVARCEVGLVGGSR